MTVDDIASRDLNIVVPDGSTYGLERLKALLSCSGSSITFDGSPGIVHENHAKRFVKLMLKSVSLPILLDIPCFNCGLSRVQ